MTTLVEYRLAQTTQHRFVPKNLIYTKNFYRASVCLQGVYDPTNMRKDFSKMEVIKTHWSQLIKLIFDIKDWLLKPKGDLICFT